MLSCYTLFVHTLSCIILFHLGYGGMYSDSTARRYVAVEVQQGRLRGEAKTSKYFPGDIYYSFQYIPYAKPPVGPLRFKDPEEPESWCGILDTLGDEDSSQEDDPNKFHVRNNYTDDILYLSVDTPELGESGKPVIVRISSMEFTAESEFTADFFSPGHYMVQDVVLVNLKYRHNVLGFLCLDHKEVLCNAGLKDQVMALKWVQRNIAKFSGNPNNVTLHGIGLGGMFIHYHLMSQLSRGLFHGVIIQSGCALTPHSYVQRDIAIKRAFRLGKLLGFDAQNADQLLQFLRLVPPQNLVDKAKKTFQDGETVLNFGFAFVPCVEVPANNKSFLIQSPRTLLKKGQFTKVPIIFGITNVEEIIIKTLGKLTDSNFESENTNFREYLPPNMGLPDGSEESKNVLREMKNFYFCDRPISRNTTEGYVKLIYDLLFTVGFDEAVRMQLEHLQTSFYVFEFKMCTANFLFKPAEERKEEKRKSEMIYKFLTKMWATFVRTGNPNYEGFELNWKPATKDNISYLLIQDTIKQVNGRVAENRMKMWQRLYERYPHKY